MTDEQIRMLLSLGGDEARLLLDNGECELYKKIQRKMMKLVREYQVQLPLNCLQFMFCWDRLSRSGVDGRKGAEVRSSCDGAKLCIFTRFVARETGTMWVVTDPPKVIGILMTSSFADLYRKVQTQIPIARHAEVTASQHPAVSSLEACKTPAR